MEGFLNWLILLLIGLLFGKDTLLPAIMGKMGIELKKNQGAGTEETARLRNDFQKIYMEMQTLSAHFNHETTDQWADVKKLLEKQNEKHDESLQLIRELAKYGIKCRRE